MNIELLVMESGRSTSRYRLHVLPKIVGVLKAVIFPNCVSDFLSNCEMSIVLFCSKVIVVLVFLFSLSYFSTLSGRGA
jgi:hypothetical protein